MWHCRRNNLGGTVNSGVVWTCENCGNTLQSCQTLKLHMRGYHKGMLQQSKVHTKPGVAVMGQTYTGMWINWYVFLQGIS